MHIEMRLLDEGFRTHTTLIRSFIIVQHCMFQEHCLCHKSFATFLTNVFLLFLASLPMNSIDMVCHMGLLCESFTTLFTLVSIAKLKHEYMIYEPPGELLLNNVELQTLQ